MAEEFEVVLVPGFELGLRQGDGAGWTGKHWEAERELDRTMRVTAEAMKAARERMPPGCNEEAVLQVAKGWKPVSAMCR